QRFVVRTHGGAVTAAQDRDPQIALAIKPGDVFDARRLARSAQRQVADADHRNPRPEYRFGAAVIPGVADRDDPAVRPTRGAQGGPLEGRADAARPAAAQAQVS